MNVKSLLFAALITLSMLAGIAQAQTPPQPPQVRPVLMASDCNGIWNANVFDGHAIGVNGTSQYLRNERLPIQMTPGMDDTNGNAYCYGEVVGDDGSNVNLQFDRRTNVVEVYMYMYQPTPFGGSSMYLMEIHFKLFANPTFGQYFFGRMDADFIDQSNGVRVPTIMYHGNADISKNNGAKGRPMPSN